MKPLILFAVLLTSISTSAAADDVDDAAKRQARKHYNAGLALFDRGRLLDAAESLERAVDIRATKNNIHGLALCYLALERHAEALRLFDRLLGEFRSRLGWELRREILSKVEEINNVVARLDVEVNLDGAEISVDGEGIGRSPLHEPIVLLTGEHRVEVSMPDHDTILREITVLPGDSVTLDFKLVESRARIFVWTKRAGAEVYLDGMRVGTTPIREGLALRSGVFGVSVRRPGFQPVDQRIELDPGEEMHLRYQLKRKKKETAEATTHRHAVSIPVSGVRRVAANLAEAPGRAGR